MVRLLPIVVIDGFTPELIRYAPPFAIHFLFEFATAGDVRDWNERPAGRPAKRKVKDTALRLVFSSTPPVF
jgi:hypothetical protein